MELRPGTRLMRRWPLLLRHACGWMIFITYEISFVRFSGGRGSPLADYVAYYGLNLLLFYFNAHVILPFAVKSFRSVLLIPLLMFIELGLYLGLKYGLDYLLAFPANGVLSPAVYIERLLIPNVYRGVYFLGFSTLYWSILRVLNLRKRIYETEKNQLIVEKEKAGLEKNLAEASNAYLQHQINPHFLFNALTFIHNTYYKYSRDASECVLLLAEIMRYSLDEAERNGRTTLADEIEQIENFIKLNQLRFDDGLYIDFNTEGDFENQEIIPLILLTLTENIFKHGNLKHPSEAAKLYITVDERGMLKFTTWNIKKHRPEEKRVRSIGIRNVIKRLDYSYPGCYQLDIRDGETSYELELSMQL
ncbi:MAG: sensor histidine kinase [Sphingobacteriales bacterium]